MLVAQKCTMGAALRWRNGLWGCLAVFVLCLLSLGPYLRSSTELVRMRNALLLVDTQSHRFDWTPSTVPEDFMQERGAIDPVFVEAAERLGLASKHSDWDKVITISQHLLSNPQLLGSPIQSNLRDTYQHILKDGTGYCGDFTRVFMAFAIAAGIPVRAWAFSLDGFGGHGHIWPEIWNRQLHRWQLVDIFNNFYFHGQDGIPISAADFRHAMLAVPGSIHAARLSPGARPGYEHEHKLWAWYRQGLAEWYMIWGNNVFSYDLALRARNLGHFSRSMEQLEAIAIGVYPHVSLMVDENNRGKAEALWRVRMHLLLVGWIGFLSVLGALLCLVMWMRAQSSQKPAVPQA